MRERCVRLRDAVSVNGEFRRGGQAGRGLTSRAAEPVLSLRVDRESD